MSFKAQTPATPPAPRQVTIREDSAAIEAASRRDAGLLFSTLGQLIIYAAAALGLLLAITLTALDAFGVALPNHMPAWVAIPLLICLCVYGYFDLRLDFRPASKAGGDVKPGQG